MWQAVQQLLGTQTTLLGAALVATAISGIMTFLVSRWTTRDRLSAEYEHEQRKRIREVIGKYHGRLLNAANSLNYRFWNLYQNEAKGWMEAGGRYDRETYYFTSFVYRFLNVFAILRQFENEAIVLDVRNARKSDFTFLNYTAALYWVMTDVALFDGLPYEGDRQVDHFYSDRLRNYGLLCCVEGNFPAYSDFCEFIAKNRSIDPVLRFFDDLSKHDGRLRWDRLVALHLLLLAFINGFGYQRQVTDSGRFSEVAAQLQNKRILANLVNWLPRHELGKDVHAKSIRKALHATKLTVRPNNDL